MYTIAMSIQKGGTGKTSLSVTFAAELSKHGKTVIIDADPQGTATSWFNPDALEYDLADYFFGQCNAENIVLKTNVENLDLVPTAGVGGQLKMYSETKGVSDYMCFKRLVRDLSAMGYEYAVIDLSPAFGTFEKNALEASDEAITPIIPDPNGIDGLQIFINRLQEAKQNDMTEKPVYKKIVVNQHNKSIAMHVQYTDMIMQSLSQNYQIYKVPVDQAFSKARAANIPIQEYKGTKAETINTVQQIIADIIKK